MEGDEQAVRNGKDDIENHNPANDPDVNSVDGDTKKEEADSDLEGCSREGVEYFAKEPVLFASDGQYRSHRLMVRDQPLKPFVQYHRRAIPFSCRFHERHRKVVRSDM